MMENGMPRKRRQLSPEEKWELFLEVASQQLTQADAARKWGVDVSTVIRIRQLSSAFGRVILPLGKYRRETSVPGGTQTYPIQFALGEPGVKQGQ